MPGGYAEASVKEKDVAAAAAFAVKAQEKTLQKKDAPPVKLALVKILSAQTQVVAGLNFRLKLSVRMHDAPKEAEAVVYRKLSGEYELTSWVWK